MKVIKAKDLWLQKFCLLTSRGQYVLKLSIFFSVLPLGLERSSSLLNRFSVFLLHKARQPGYFYLSLFQDLEDV